MRENLREFWQAERVFIESQVQKLVQCFPCLSSDRLSALMAVGTIGHPYFRREEIRELDSIAIEKYHIPSIVLMENAGAGASHIILDIVSHGPVAIFCGRGNNGGDGFVIARHLYNHGIAVEIYFIGEIGEVAPQSDPGINLRILNEMQLTPVEILQARELKVYLPHIQKAEIVVDALLGTGLKGPVREPFAEVIDEMKTWNCPVVAIDIPSGLDANTGDILGTALPAFLTITFGLPKRGFLYGKGPEIAGQVVLVDISIPRVLWEKFY